VNKLHVDAAKPNKSKLTVHCRNNHKTNNKCCEYEQAI